MGEVICSNNKVNELAESLEMSQTFGQPLEDDSNAAYELLKAWADEMQNHAPNLRTHLSHHLITIGINDVANRYV